MEEMLQWLAEHAFIKRLIILGIATTIILVVVYFIKKVVSKNVTDTDSKYRVRKLSNVFGFILVFSAVLFIYSDKLGSVGVTLGLAGAGIAFSLQAVIISFAGWLNIMMTGQIKVGQRVKIGEITGDVIDIGVMKTTIMEVGDWIDGDLYNGRITSISNNFVFNTPVQNYSGDYPFLWDEISIPLRAESDFHLARQVFKDVTMEICGDYARESRATWNGMKDKFRIEDASVDPSVTLRFDENWITFTIRYVVDYTKRRTTKDLLYTRILEEINKRDKEIMIAIATSEVTSIVRQKESGENPVNSK